MPTELQKLKHKQQKINAQIQELEQKEKNIQVNMQKFLNYIEKTDDIEAKVITSNELKLSYYGRSKYIIINTRDNVDSIIKHVERDISFERIKFKLENYLNALCKFNTKIKVSRNYTDRDYRFNIGGRNFIIKQEDSTFLLYVGYNIDEDGHGFIEFNEYCNGFTSYIKIYEHAELYDIALYIRDIYATKTINLQINL